MQPQNLHLEDVRIKGNRQTPQGFPSGQGRETTAKVFLNFRLGENIYVVVDYNVSRGG